MTLFVCWVVFPVVLGALALGCGLLLEHVSKVTLPGALILPAGLAVVVVVSQFATLSDATAELATPAVIALAIVGVILRAPWWQRGLDRWALAAALAVFAVFAAPVVLSGSVTLAGYIKLDDTATWLAMTDRVMDHGRSLAHLAPSSYEATLDSYLNKAYPVGSFLPLGLGGTLVGRDIAWVFQPYLAFLAAMMALSLYTLAGTVVTSRPVRFAAVFIASQSALLFGYSLWGGVKEMAAAWTVALVAALISPVLREKVPLTGLLPLAIASAATLDALSFGGGAWLAPMLVPALVGVVLLRGRIVALHRAVAFVALGAVLALPALLSAESFLRPGLGESLTAETEVGNLVRPLSWLQFFGIWPTGDFRFNPRELGATHVLIAVTFVAGVLGIAWAWRRRAWGVILYIGAAVVGTVIITRVGSPWVDAKALATASPAPVLAGLLGAAAILKSGRRVEAAVVAAVIAGGVLWSNALAYHDVDLAPHERFAELEQISHRIAGKGPTLMTEYEPFGVRHFLRDADPEGASELRRRLVLLRNGKYLEKLETADIDEFQLASVLVYRNLVLRRSPTGSRPPSLYRRIWSGRYYDVWQRPQGENGKIAEHLSLGSSLEPAAVPNCGQVLRLARLAGPAGLVASVSRPNPIVRELSQVQHPAGWTGDPSDASVLYPQHTGTMQFAMLVPSSARYGVWIGGAFRGRLEIWIDGKLVDSRRNDLSHAGQWVPMGDALVPAGSHQVKLDYKTGGLHPGSDGEAFPLGPFALAPETVNTPVSYLPARRSSSLCGKRLDWVEALR